MYCIDEINFMNQKKHLSRRLDRTFKIFRIIYCNVILSHMYYIFLMLINVNEEKKSQRGKEEEPYMPTTHFSLEKIKYCSTIHANTSTKTQTTGDPGKHNRQHHTYVFFGFYSSAIICLFEKFCPPGVCNYN